MKLFSNMKILTKLIITFLIVAMISVAVGVISIKNIKDIQNNGKDLYQNYTVPIEISGNLTEEFQSVRIYIRQMIMYSDIEDLTNCKKDIEEGISNVENYEKDLKAAVPDSESDIIKQLSDFDSAWAEYITYKDQLVELSFALKDVETYALVNSDEVVELNNRIFTSLDKITSLCINRAETKLNDNSNIANSSITSMVICIVIGSTFALLLGFVISKSISKPIGKMVKLAESIADNNFDISINDKAHDDELGKLSKALQKMSDNLNDFMNEINTAADQVASGSRQVSDSSVVLSQGATEQASSIEQLTASIDEISAQTKINTGNANKANGLAIVAKENAVEGNNHMVSMIKAMQEIDESSNSIYKIIKVIDDIAFQTNILALNAAVEAARAGQHGRGFAVVAEEVRNLAAKSAEAAKDTTAMIEGSIKKAETGKNIANDTAAALKKIVDAVDKVADTVNEIATASNEQSVGIEQVNQGILQVSQVVQANSATSEETAAASEQLLGQAQSLKSHISNIKLRKSSNHNNTTKKAEPNVPVEEKPEGKKTVEPKVKKQKRIILSDSELGKY